MIIPSYWAEAKLKTKQNGRDIMVHRFGWSELDQDDAQQNAERRVQAALDAITSGEKMAWREYKVPYNGAEGVPIREEVIKRYDDCVLTRNSYGAVCLNVEDVVFADLDFEYLAAPPLLKLFSSIFIFIGVFIIAKLLLNITMSAVIVALFFALVLFSPMAYLMLRVFEKFSGNPEQRARRRVDAFIKKHPDWLLRLYRTPAGFRVLVMHRKFHAHDNEVKALFQALNTDPVYVRMCERQICFRARLSPKPWRIGMSKHIGPGVWPIKVDYLSRREAWVREYDAASQAYAACKFVVELGNGRSDSAIDAIRRLHDEWCRAESNNPIA
jgi:hypothetical protein